MKRRSAAATYWITPMLVTGLTTLPAAAAHAQQSASANAFNPPSAGGPRRWQSRGETNLYAQPLADANDIGQVSKGAILENLGCNQSGNQLWCQVHPFRGGKRAYVRAAMLDVVAGPDGVIATGADTSKQRAKKRQFDSKGTIRCAQEQGQALGQCKIGVARSSGGDATAVVSFANGFSRSLFFAHGEFMRASATMSGVGTDTDWRIENDQYKIRVDDQQYVIPYSYIVNKNK